MFKKLNFFAIALVALNIMNCNGPEQNGLDAATQNEAQEEMKEKSIMDVLIDKELKKLVNEQFVVLHNKAVVNSQKVNELKDNINLWQQDIPFLLKKLGYSPTLLLSKQYIQQQLEETWNKIVVKDLKKYQEAVLINNITIDDFYNKNNLFDESLPEHIYYIPEPTTINEHITNCFVVSSTTMDDITNNVMEDSIDNLMQDNEYSDADKNFVTYYVWILIAATWMSSIYGMENQYVPLNLPKSVPPHLR